LLLVEKEDQVAKDQSGHNSGLIHSGIYYKHGSLKARLWVEGPKAMVEFCRDYNIACKICGQDVAGTLGYPGFWCMAGKYWRSGAGEFYRSLSKQAFVRALQRPVPEVGSSNLVADGSGVRAQAVRRDDL
jgi:L-2-hydroxyglutarate oxidase LhgO